MGVESLLLAAGLGLSAWSASNTLSNAEKTAKAEVEAGKLAAENKAKTVLAKAASQKVSFLSSGFALEGTPLSVINATYDTGLEDVNQIIKNANTSSSNTMSSARSQALGQLLQGSIQSFSFANSGSQIMNSFSEYGASSGWWGGFDPKSKITWNSGRTGGF